MAELSPIDLLRMRLEAAGGYLTPEEIAANKAQTSHDLWSATPVIGNAMSAESAVQNYADMINAPDWWSAAKSGAFGALDTVGAVVGLPWGKTAGKVAKGGSSRLNTFVGPEAKTANKAALQNAEAMRTQGASPDDIWQRTGWSWDERGLPYFEVDDSAAKLTGNANPQKFGDFIDHPELFAARPDIADMPFSRNSGRDAGHFRIGSNSQYAPFPARIDVGPTSPDKALVTALHEGQHAADWTRGGSYGATARAAAPADHDEAVRRILGDDVMGPVYERMRAATAARAADPASEQARREWLDAQRAQRKAEKTTGRTADPEFMAYRHNPGEVRARNTAEQRRTMSDDARRAAAPWQTQDAVPFGGAADSPSSQVFVPVEEGKLSEVARRKREGGASNAKVHEDTGLLFGPDGTLRRFLPNRNMDIDWSFAPGDVTTVGAMVDHPTLFRELPQLQNRIVKVTDRVEQKPGQLPRGISRTDPVTGDFEWSKLGGDPYADMAKMLQYDVNDMVGFSSAGRHNFSDNLASINKAQLDAARSGADAQARRGYINNLEQHKDAIHKGIGDKARFKDMDRRIGDVSAGSTDSKIVRASTTHDIGYPYAQNAPWIRGYWKMPAFEDMLAFPPSSATPDDMAQFVTDWWRYGSGRGQ